ncbi:AAA family ATPase [Paenibacillus sp. FSL H8-0280]|uniref:AAA family ATPase n=1 Tax=Paenibacillus sp. FSL H8-0280 TaxID=2921382 RepID=UPI0032468BD5
MITKFYIRKLFGSRNIEVDFNRDLTLIVGPNGSGKTTVLNIISFIATGNISSLFEYEFRDLEIHYIYKERAQKLKIIKKEYNIKVEWKGRSKNIDYEEIRFLSHKRKLSSNLFTSSDVLNIQDDVSGFFEEISSELNLLYLPLSRDNRPFDIKKEHDIYFSKNYIHNEMENENNSLSYLDESLLQVNYLIKEKHRKIMHEYEKLNEDMPKKMIQASLGYLSNPVNDFGSIMNVISNLTIEYSRVADLKRAFYDMNLLQVEYEGALDSFFDNLRIAQKELSKKEDDSERIKYVLTERPNWLSFFTNAPLIDNYLKWLDIVQQTNEMKSHQYKPIDMFLNIVNDFLRGSFGGKEIDYNDIEGKLFFINHNDPQIKLPLNKLSSGEKQIIVFFAYLIFKINPEKGGVFIIDEPELSLHLSWQKKLCRAIMEAAPNLQFIFATHSPEIIGPYRDKCKNVRGDLSYA